MTAGLDRALASVAFERGRQDAKWGEQDHDPAVWLAILVEEVGELGEAILNDKFPGSAPAPGRMRGEAQQVAAVAVAFIEYLDRTRIGQCPECSGSGIDRSQGHCGPCRSCNGSGDS